MAIEVLRRRMEQIDRIRTLAEILPALSARLCEGLDDLERRFIDAGTEAITGGAHDRAAAIMSLLKKHKVTLERVRKKHETVAGSLGLSTHAIVELVKEPEALGDPEDAAIDRRLTAALERMETLQAIAESMLQELDKIGKELDRLIHKPGSGRA